jgi:hypothetical protein
MAVGVLTIGASVGATVAATLRDGVATLVGAAVVAAGNAVGVGRVVVELSGPAAMNASPRTAKQAGNKRANRRIDICDGWRC